MDQTDDFWENLDYSAAFAQRHSVRRFLPLPVDASIVEKILQAAHAAPSAHNQQPWRFVVLNTEQSRTNLADGLAADFRRDLAADSLPAEQVEAQVQRSQARIRQAPVAVLVCMQGALGDDDPAVFGTAAERRQGYENLMGMQSVAMAGENLLLAAAAEGLGAVWLCAPLFASSAARHALDLPLDWQPQGLVLLGYPAGEPRLTSRRPLAEVVRWL